MSYLTPREKRFIEGMPVTFMVVDEEFVRNPGWQEALTYAHNLGKPIYILQKDGVDASSHLEGMEPKGVETYGGEKGSHSYRSGQRRLARRAEKDLGIVFSEVRDFEILDIDRWRN